jgi:hypothetical protein
MVRGNWQKRVERAQDRRDLAKIKKIRKGQKAVYKALVQKDLWPLLDKFKLLGICDLERPPDKLHLWVDCLPKSREKEERAAADLEEDDDVSSRKGKKKPKKKSKGLASPAAKKAHPRSHENVKDDEGDEDEQLLCHQYFFTGKCDAFEKGGKPKKNASSCVHCHYSAKKELTLATVLNRKSRKERDSSSPDEQTTKTVINRASNAAALAQMKLDGIDIDSAEMEALSERKNDNFGIEMLHYMDVSLLSAQSGKIDAIDLIMKMFEAENVNIGAIAYVAYGDVLLFDRYDGGVLTSEEAELQIFGGGAKGMSTDDNSSAISDGIIHFPATVLEQVISYLPGGYAGILPSLCKSLYEEIGTTSPSLWKELMERNGWALPDDPRSDPKTLYKTFFVSHYRACERVKSLKDSIKNLIERLPIEVESRNTASIQIEDTCNRENPELYSSVFNSTIVIWDEGSVLVGTRGDCVLRLFRTYVRQNSGDEIALREVFYMRVAPVPLSKKFICRQESIALDERYVACSFEMNDRYFVTSITKDDLLSNSTETAIEGNGDILTVLDISLSFLEYYSNTDKDSVINTFDFLDDVDVDSIHETVKFNLKSGLRACGNGVFCVIVHISVVVGEEQEQNHLGILSLSLSKGRNTIVDFIALRPPDGDVWPELTTNYKLKKRADSTEILCYFPPMESLSNATNIPVLESSSFVTVVDRHGRFGVFHHKSPVSTLNESFRLAGSAGEDFCLRLPEFIATSFFVRSTERSKTQLAFQITPTRGDAVESQVLILERHYERIVSMKCLDRNYVILICAKDDDPDAIDGNWFYGDSQERALLDFIIIHVPSMKEIQCIKLSLLRNHGNLTHIEADFDTGNKSMLAGFVEGCGLVLSGAALKNFTLDNDITSKTGSTPKSTKKTKKKKRLVAGKSGKKDGFARGQGLRGG